MIYVLKYAGSVCKVSEPEITSYVLLRESVKKMVPECLFFGTNVTLFCHFF